jgi:hypothetical protein
MSQYQRPHLIQHVIHAGKMVRRTAGARENGVAAFLFERIGQENDVIGRAPAAIAAPVNASSLPQLTGDKS